MLDALGINLRILRRDTDRLKKRQDCFVSLADTYRHSLARGSQADGLIRLGREQVLLDKSLDDSRHRDVADTHHRRELADAGLALFINKLGDGFDVVFGVFIFVGSARIAKPLGCLG